MHDHSLFSPFPFHQTGHIQHGPTLLPGITAEDRAVAIVETGKVFKELLATAKELGLPPTDETLKLMYAAYEARSIHAAIERDRKTQEEQMYADVKRAPMPVRSRVGDFACSVDAKLKNEVTSIKTPNCPPKMIVSVTARPQCVAYRVEDIQITKHPAHWRVHAITCGNVDQTVQQGPLGGVAFDEHGILRNVRLRTLGTAMDFVMHVEYIGPNPEGEPFEAVTVGLEAQHA
jgi:hypothetical protein